MLDIGFQELVLIFAVAVMVFGPQKLPELSRSLAKGIGQLRKALFDVKHEINKEMKILDEESGGKGSSFMEDVPKWKAEALNAIYGDDKPETGGVKGPGEKPSHTDASSAGSGGEGPVNYSESDAEDTGNTNKESTDAKAQEMNDDSKGSKE